jgi:hypothetical protein
MGSLAAVGDGMLRGEFGRHSWPWKHRKDFKPIQRAFWAAYESAGSTFPRYFRQCDIKHLYCYIVRYACFDLGCRTVDSSIGGLGGCPYSMKPVGNVCTENVVFALQEAGLKTGVDL